MCLEGRVLGDAACSFEGAALLFTAHDPATRQNRLSS